MKKKKSFIFSFTLLQNSTSLDEFENLLMNIFNFYCQKAKNTTFFSSLTYIKKKLIDRKLYDLNDIEMENGDYEKRRKDFQEIDKSNFVLIKDESFLNLKKNHHSQVISKT